MICICFAMDKEAAPLLALSTVLEEKRSGFAKLFLCSAFDKKFVVLVSGIGKGFASSGLTSAVLLYDIDKIINAGVAGSTSKEKAPVLSAVVSSGLVQHDMDTSILGDPKGFISGIEAVELPADEGLRNDLMASAKKSNILCVEGLISSGDAFMAHGSPVKMRVIDTFHPLVVDMESACFAQVAYAFNIPYCSLRLISDCEHPEYEYAQNVMEASRRVNLILENYLKEVYS